MANVKKQCSKNRNWDSFSTGKKMVCVTLLWICVIDLALKGGWHASHAQASTSIFALGLGKPSVAGRAGYGIQVWCFKPVLPGGSDTAMRFAALATSLYTCSTFGDTSRCMKIHKVYLFDMIWVWIYFCCLNFTHWFIPLPLQCFFSAKCITGVRSWFVKYAHTCWKANVSSITGPQKDRIVFQASFFGNYVTIFGGCIFFGHQQNQPKTRYNPWGFSGTSGEASQIPSFSKFSRIKDKHTWTWWFGRIAIQNTTCDLVWRFCKSPWTTPEWLVPRFCKSSWTTSENICLRLFQHTSFPHTP